MANGKAEINLEVSTGFFRIATDNLVYNITVLDSPGAAAAPVTGGRALPSPAAPPPQSPQPMEMPVGPGGDDFYRQVSTDIYKDIGNLAKSLSSTMMDLPMEDRKIKRAELDEAGEKIEDAKNQLRDIVSMTERATMEIMDHVEKVQDQTNNVKDLLAELRDHPAFSTTGDGGDGDDDPPREEVVDLADAADAGAVTAKIARLSEELGRAGELLGNMESAALAAPAPQPVAEAAPEAAPAGRRYLFPLDVIFQTIYELCTNETVKSHISMARQQAEEIFDYPAFVEAISAKVSELEADSDNFYTVPLADVLEALRGSCSEKKIKNLLTKMEENIGGIFLDSSLPLEVPPIEEVAAVPEAAPEAAPESVDELAPAPADGGDLAEARLAIDAALVLVNELTPEIQAMTGGLPAGNGMSRADQKDVFKKIESAFGVASNIYEDVTRITEALSFQDLSGQQILKIIKLLSDFQFQLLSLVVSFGSQLKNKERNATITPEESKRLAQDDVDRYLRNMTEAAQEGPLDQDTVNKMLEDFGF